MTLLRASPLLLAAVLLSACSDSSPPSAPEQAAAVPSASAGDNNSFSMTPAATASLASIVVQAASVPRETAFDGAVEAVNQSTVSAQTSGRVVEMPYDVGDYVEKDAVIVRFTATEQRARSGATEAALAEAKARLAEAQLAYDRTQDVYEKKLIAKAQFDKAAADLASARARAEAAQAALAEAREGLGYTVIRAPYAGIVVARRVQIGETVTPGRPLMTGVSLEHLRVVVEIPQQHIGPLRKHRKARVILPDGASVEAAELRIPPNADAATHSFRVLVTLPPGERGVFPGTLVKVAFISGETEQILLPGSALVRRGEVTGVYVLGERGQIGFRYLRTGTAAAADRIPVLAGLAAGERIALDPIAAGIAYKQQTPQTGAGA